MNQTATQTQTFTLDGATYGGVMEKVEFAPRGSVVVVTSRYPRPGMPVHRSEMTVTRAREYYASLLRQGYQRVA
jgi:hypothetical protein